MFCFRDLCAAVKGVLQVNCLSFIVPLFSKRAPIVVFNCSQPFLFSDSSFALCGDPQPALLFENKHS